MLDLYMTRQSARSFVLSRLVHIICRENYGGVYWYVDAIHLFTLLRSSRSVYFGKDEC